MEEQNAPIFSQAKLEYTNQLIDTLTPHFFDGIKSIYDEAKTVNNINKEQSITLLFRSFLEKVPSWSNVIIESETERIIKITDCDWLDDLITAVFISHTKILTSIGSNTSNANIDLVIPKTINFIHKCYINIAREMWKNPYLFNESILASEYQKNMRTVELIIKESMENTIRQLLPIKEILKQHLDTYESNQTELQKRVDTNNLRQMLLEEIKNLNLINTNKEEDKVEEDKVEEDKVEEDKVEEDEVVEDKVEEDEVVEDKVEEDEVVEDKVEGGKEKIYIDEDNIEDDYVSVDEETIKKNCDNLEINTINNEEDKYDNADIINSKESTVKDKTILEKFIQNLLPEEDVNDIDDEHTNDNNDIDNNDNSNVITNIEDILSPRKEYVEPDKKDVEPDIETGKGKYSKEVEKNPESEPKKEKELISVNKVSDTETVDEFYNDVSRLIESKGRGPINKSPNKYTLFDDADNNEY